MAHFLPPELVRQVNKLEWPYRLITMHVTLARAPGHVHPVFWTGSFLKPLLDSQKFHSEILNNDFV